LSQKGFKESHELEKKKGKTQDRKVLTLWRLSKERGRRRGGKGEIPGKKTTSVWNL